MTLPYQLSVDPQTGFITFLTDHNCTYYCRFVRQNEHLSPLLGIYDLEIHELDFLPSCQQTKKIRDNRISKTICSLIESYFAVSDKRVLVYVCDGIDEKQQGRKQLFKRWHSDYLSDFLIHVPITIRIDSVVELEDIHAGLLIRIDFPHMAVLNQELINKAEGIISSKFTFERPV